MYKVFADFDGTIAENDVGAQLFIKYADKEKCMAAVNSWLNGDISSIEMYRIECETAVCTPEQLSSLAKEQRLDIGFEAFYHHCKQLGIDLTILSDGFKTYIEKIVAKYDMGDLEIKANDVVVENARLFPQFPYQEKSCGKCANCKGYHLRQFRKAHPDTTIIYIGDGFSDRCGADLADLVFAKRDLRKYCLQQNMQFINFTDFSDVIKECVTRGIFG